MRKDLNRAIKLCKELLDIITIKEEESETPFYINASNELKREGYYLLARIENVLNDKEDERILLKTIWDFNRSINIHKESFETFARNRTFKKAEVFYEKIIYASAKLDIIEMYAIRHRNIPF